MSLTILSMFDAQVRAGGHRAALRSKRGGRWTTTTWDEWNRKSRAIAAMLIANGIARGDRVAILSNTREEWVVVDLAIMMAGAIPVPIYPTLTPEESAHIIQDSGSVAVFVENPQAMQKLLPPSVPERSPCLRFAVVFECQSLRDIPGQDMHRKLSCEEVAAACDIPVTVLSDAVSRGETLLEERENGEVLEQRIAAVGPEDLASIVYTARAEGRHKGAMLTHASFCFQVSSSREMFGLSERDEQLLFLPLAHILGKALFLISLRVGCATCFAESMLRAIDNAAELNPTFFGAVPRVFEKFYQVAITKAAEEGKVKRRLFAWAIDTGLRASRLRRKGHRPGPSLAVQLRYADKLVLHRLRSRFGDKLRFGISGGAPLAPELAEWFDAIGVTIYEGYGLTETAGATNCNRPSQAKFGTVGPPLAGVENKIASDGEILLRGANVMKGYWGDPTGTAEVIDEDGWLHSGDIGNIDAEGMLQITDRKKDLIVTSGGKNIAPQNIENMIRQSPWVGHAVVVGDRRQYLTVLLTLDQRALAHWASENEREADLERLSEDPEVRALIQLDIDTVNHRLASFETIKSFRILPGTFSVTTGELTPTGKVRRGVVTKKFQAVIEEMYREN